MVRKLLHGKLANTTFVVLTPDGETQLSRASRLILFEIRPGGLTGQQLKMPTSLGLAVCVSKSVVYHTD